MHPGAQGPALPADLPVVRAAQLTGHATGGAWSFDSLVGILSEISEERPSGALSFIAGIVAEAQRRHEPVAWIAREESIFFPPDLADRGIDCAAVAVIRAGGQSGSLTAAEWLLRSGAVGLVVVDAEAAWNVDDAPLGRIQKLAKRSQAAVVFLTRKSPRQPSLGSRVSLRGCITRTGLAPFLVATRRSRGVSGRSGNPAGALRAGTSRTEAKHGARREARRGIAAEHATRAEGEGHAQEKQVNALLRRWCCRLRVFKRRLPCPTRLPARAWHWTSPWSRTME